MDRAELKQSILSVSKGVNSSGGLRVQSMNERLSAARLLPDIESYFDGLINLHGTNMIFGDAGIGKSAFCMWLFNQYAEDTGNKVLYLDFELSEQQLKTRYKNETFSDNFNVATIGDSNNIFI